MALTLHKCPRCGQCYYDGTPHQCPPPPSPPPPPRSPAANDDVYLLYAVLLGLIGIVILALMASDPKTGVSPMVLVAAIPWCAVNTVIGGSIGAWRGRPGFGIFWGMLAGPLGWLVVLLSADARRRCPWCQMVIPDAAVVCGHCTRQLPQT